MINMTSLLSSDDGPKLFSPLCPVSGIFNRERKRVKCIALGDGTVSALRFRTS